jgi:hypothetical protein
MGSIHPDQADGARRGLAGLRERGLLQRAKKDEKEQG